MRHRGQATVQMGQELHSLRETAVIKNGEQPLSTPKNRKRNTTFKPGCYFTEKKGS
jgi:hypothetical protein